MEASVVLAAGSAEYADALREMGLDAGMYDALHRLFASASAAGLGDAAWMSVVEHVARP